MNDTNLHYNLLIHVLYSLRASNLWIRVRFGRGQTRTCSRHKIPHFQGFKPNKVHNSSWQTPGSKFMSLRVTRLKIHLKIWNCIFKPLMPVPSHIAYAVSVFSLWTHLNQSKWTPCENISTLTTSTIFHIPTITKRPKVTSSVHFLGLTELPASQHL